MNYKHFVMPFPQLVLRGRAVPIGHFLELVDCSDRPCQRICRAKNRILKCLVHICGQWFLTLLAAVVTCWWLHIQLPLHVWILPSLSTAWGHIILWATFHLHGNGNM